MSRTQLENHIQGRFSKRNRLCIRTKDLITFMLSITMLVDFANGMLSGLHIGELFRLLLLAICSMYIFRYGRRDKNVYLLIIAYLAMNVILSSLINGGAMTNISMALKSMIVFAVFFTLHSMHLRGRIGLNEIETIVKNNLYYAPGLFILTYLFDVGRGSYSFAGQSLGFKSGFLSLNSVNIALMVLYIFCIDKVFKIRKKKWLFYSLYVAIPMAMLGTKTGYAIIVAVPLLYVLLGIKRKRTWTIVIFATVAVALVARPFVVKILPLFQGIIDRQKMLYSQRSLWEYLTITRNIRVSKVLDYYSRHSNIMTIVFGSGYYWIHNIASVFEGASSSVIPLEMDWADLFVTYGIVGMAFVYYFVIRIIIRNRTMRKIGGGGGTAYYWMAVILLLYGTVAGHLFFEAISSTFYGVILAGLCIAGRQTSMATG